MFTPKSPSEIVDIGFQLSAIIPSGVTITDAAICVTAIPSTVLPETLDLIGLPTIEGNSVLQRISGGIIGAYYSLTLTVTLSNGEIMQEQSSISIVNKGC